MIRLNVKFDGGLNVNYHLLKCHIMIHLFIMVSLLNFLNLCAQILIAYVMMPWIIFIFWKLYRDLFFAVSLTLLMFSSLFLFFLFIICV